MKRKSNVYCEQTERLGASEELVEELSSPSSKIPIGTSARVQKIKVSSKKQIIGTSARVQKIKVSSKKQML